ncbi:thioesterase domain-containing protein [Ruegeria sp. 2205SS24-7]|uniref:thioesterase II family protein n=1 Tax=Ruegeria discodermiae TaxID=3064389 RepID=UPI0027406451|nr:thioesterase domain-containing protein [Ruegeria sp. 2205SS24-7]MDP5218850.1 thioesterase domain-containing protein [Ruegeria sp. 2205SS24-7]
MTKIANKNGHAAPVYAAATIACKSAWLPHFDIATTATARLFVLPFAGGGAAQFLPLRGAAPDWLDIQPIQTPGRESRLLEPAINDLPVLINALMAEILPCLDRPFAFLGYSMGARMSLALAHALLAGRHPQPRQLIVAAHAAPSLPSRVPIADSLDSDAFWKLIAQYEGTPGDVLKDDELKALVEPSLRADFRIARQAVTRAGLPLDIPILALSGLSDPYVGPGDMQPWRDETSGPFRLEVIDGGHFFFRSHFEHFSGVVFDTLEPLASEHGKPRWPTKINES